MKLLVFVLVLANVLFYAFANGYFGRPENPDAGRVAQQVQPERLRLVSRGEAPQLPQAPQLPASADEKPAEAAAKDAGNDRPAAEEPAAPAESTESKAAGPAICLVWRQLTPADADRLGSLFDKRFADFKVARKTIAAETRGWWVNIPPLPGKAEVERKIGELRDLGVTEIFPVPDGPNRNAISLGIFSSEKGARDRLAELKAKGVRSATVGPRSAKEDSVNLQVRGPASARASVLKAAADAVGNAEAQACK